ncbi:ribokinase, partial [Paenibacillus sepulcri]|nr:ribokinase [Paenibacillus sepulcri]
MKKPSIVVVGSLNMDLVISLDRLPVIGETLPGKEIHYISGGKGANQAVGCARLGAA